MAGEKKRYTLGRGKLYFAMFRTGTLIPRGELYMGNSPAFTLNSTTENLDHYGSDNGVRKKDDSIILQQDYAGSLTTDNIEPDNIAYFFMGEKKVITSVSTPVTGETIAQVEKGRWYQLGQDATNPSGVRGISAVTVTPESGSTALIAGVDYLLDLVQARIYIQPTGGIANGSSPKVAYTIGAAQRDQIIASGTVAEGALRYVQDNPTGAGGSQVSFYMPQVKLMPNGDWAIKGDTWQELPMNIEIITKGDLAAIYADGVPYNPAA